MPEILAGDWIEHEGQTSLYDFDRDQTDDATADQTVREGRGREDFALQKAEIKQSISPSRRLRALDLQAQFNHFADVWKQDTAHLSNITRKSMHPAYQRIIGMGRVAVPFMLEEFRKGKLDDWFWALSAITGENPITEDVAGHVERMAEAWLRWGRMNGYLSDWTQHLRPTSRTSE